MKQNDHDDDGMAGPPSSVRTQTSDDMKRGYIKMEQPRPPEGSMPRFDYDGNGFSDPYGHGGFLPRHSYSKER